jgi:8-oxo-dGTP pyrophosphatase MutT (NUDIX family)
MCEVFHVQDHPALIIRIAAALIEDDAGRTLLVRKTGTDVFMQAGGKLEAREKARAALVRELREEIGFELDPREPIYLGTFSAVAANEPNCLVEAELFHVKTNRTPAISAEIAEAIWVDRREAQALPLAPLTREHVLPLLKSISPDVHQAGAWRPQARSS